MNEVNKSDRYDHRPVEDKWRTRWLAEKRYKTDISDTADKAYVLDMFPYPSGEGLHVGHPLGYIGSDILARYFRAKGKNVLHPMGYDAFGLPAENYAIKTGTPPAESTTKSIARFREQMQLIGLSYDWDREIATCDPSYYKWTQWIFLKLYEKGLAYRAKAPVNWCPKDQTVLANEQVKDGRCERCDSLVEQKNLEQWFFKITAYADELLGEVDKLDWPESIKAMQRNWIGKSEGAELEFRIQNSEFRIQVFTTRPDTIFGATYLVLAPEHPLIKNQELRIKNYAEVAKYVEEARSKKELERKAIDKPKTGVELKGITATNPATGEEIPVWIADYVLTSYGTGAIMAVPAHDERDYAFATTNHLPIRHVIDPVTVREDAIKHDSFHAKKKIVALVQRQDGQLLTIKWKPELGGRLFVGGTIEAGETPEQTALREIREETGYTDLTVTEVGQETYHYKYYAHAKQTPTEAEVTFLLVTLNSEAQVASQLEAPEQDNFVVEWVDTDTARQEVIDPLHAYGFAKFGDGKIFTGEGVLVDSGSYSGLPSPEARVQLTTAFGAAQTTYRLRDWLISRQRYWGAPIPMIICDSCGPQPVPEDQLPVLLPTDVDFRPSGESPLARSEGFHKDVVCPNCQALARREVDTMDGFGDSSWYFLRYVNPDRDDVAFDKADVNRWFPVDYYVGGAEHAVLHLLYARFFTKALADMGYLAFREPFTRLRNQGLIMGEDKRKMSKRWGNVVNPDDVVHEYGADALRCFEMFMGPFEDSKPWSTQGLIGTRRWLDRIWKLQTKIQDSKFKIQNPERALSQAIVNLTEMIEEFKFNTAISSLMILTNAWEKEVSIPHNLWRDFLIILAPFAPHIAHELWEQAGLSGYPDQAGWPTRTAADIATETVTIPIQINGKVRSQIEVASSLTSDQLLELVKADPKVAQQLAGKRIVKSIAIPGRVVSLVIQ